jgi:hypothetical protein
VGNLEIMSQRSSFKKTHKKSVSATSPKSPSPTSTTAKGVVGSAVTRGTSTNSDATATHVRPKNSADQESSLKRMLGMNTEVPLMTNLVASAGPGRVRAGHGLTVRFSGEATANIINRYCSTSMYLDIYGEFVFDVVPYGLGLIARTFFPLKIAVAHCEGSGNVPYYEFTVRAKQLSNERINEVLAALVAQGDKAFVFELRDKESALIGYLPTRASLIISSLQGAYLHGYDLATVTNANIRHYGALSEYSPKRRSVTFMYLQWWKLAIISTGMIWLCFFCPTCMMRFPKFFGDVYYLNHAQILLNLLPLCPQSLSEAFALGQLKQRLSDALTHFETNETAVARLLEEAALIVGRDVTTVSVDVLLNVGHEIMKLESHVSIITRVRGMVTFVNILWLTATAGISVSIGPSVYHLVRPLQGLLLRWSKWIFNQIILPFVTKCHYYGIFEVLVYVLCSLFLLDGQRMHASTGIYVSLTGSLSLAGCFMYSTSLWTNKIPKSDQLIRSKQFRFMYCMWMASIFTPLALSFDSTLFGYCTVASVFSGLGFSTFTSHLAIFIGFDSRKETVRVNIASGLLVAAYLVFQFSLRLTVLANLGTTGATTVTGMMGGVNTMLRPFSSAVSVLGTNMFFLSMMILAETEDITSDEILSRGRHSVSMGCTLMLVLLCGLFMGIDSLSNVSLTYGTIWILIRYGRFHLRSKWNRWFLIFLFSCLFWKLSMFMHAHPAFVVSLLTL